MYEYNSAIQAMEASEFGKRTMQAAYEAGMLDPRRISIARHNELANEFAQAIAFMFTAIDRHTNAQAEAARLDRLWQT